MRKGLSIRRKKYLARKANKVMGKLFEGLVFDFSTHMVDGRQPEAEAIYKTLGILQASTDELEKLGAK